jgi:hypothetical protein
MKDKERLSLMGLQVTVFNELIRNEGIYKFGVKPYKWDSISLKETRTGWVVGFRTIYDGEKEYMEEGNIWRNVKAIPCMLVAYWPTTKPVHVPLDGWRFPLVDLYDDGFESEVPVGPKPNWPEWAKEEMSKQAKGQPRDAYGRFEAKLKRGEQK